MQPADPTSTPVPIRRSRDPLGSIFLFVLAAAIGCSHSESAPRGMGGSPETGGSGGDEPPPGSGGGGSSGGRGGAATGGAPVPTDASSTGGATADASYPDTAGPDGSPDTAPRNDRPFVHPGVLSTKAELDFMKQQVAAGRQPWKTAFDKLKASSAGSLTYQPSPRAEVACGSSGQPDLGCSDETRDSQAVYAQALLWTASGDVRYAQKCAEILDAWSAVLRSHAMSNAPLQIGWTGGGFVRAAEILRYTYPQWDKAHIDQFSTMMNTAFLPMIRNFNRYGFNGNWDAVMIEVMFSIAVFDDNHALFDEAVARYKKRLPAYIYAMADGPTPLPPDPSFTGNLVNFWVGQSVFMDGLSQETCRDLRHVQHGFGGLIQSAEIAWHQGVDLYAERDNRLLVGLEFHAKYILGAPVPANLCNGMLDGLPPMPTFEIPYNHFHNRKKLDMPLSEKIVNTHSPEGAVQHMMWGTLSHHGVGLVE
jgi:hypothetical protein